MPDEVVFNKRRIFILIALVIAFVVYKFWGVFSVEQTLYQKVKVNNLVNLCVTQADAGATTAFSYRYYLCDAKKSDADFMAHVKNETPFMITNDDKATATVRDDQLYLKVRGEIYSYRNTSYSVRIHLDAAPY
ncbi:hypothetical protein ACEZEZ_23580 [Kluyvera ascorbata]|uniref:hypothetical protein n=1 Tax=Kluyvera ascorbata TaxID=51288 RepID=UPI002ABB05C7|nr:hypothetical protein [Kluyvera ascorbata]MDZ4030937.1 hypothetical protein [Kluyvera ascorbata]